MLMGSYAGRLHWLVRGYGYEITMGDVMEACSCMLTAASASGVTEDQIKAKILVKVTAASQGNAQFITMIKNRFNI